MISTRDAPKWKFLAEAEQMKHWAEGWRPNTEHGFFNIFSPMKAYFANFFAIA